MRVPPSTHTGFHQRRWNTLQIQVPITSVARIAGIYIYVQPLHVFL